MQRCVVDEIPGGEVVTAVDHEVVLGHDLEDVLCGEPHVVHPDLDVRVECDQRLSRRLDLGHADTVDVVQDLSLEVRRVDDVEIDDTERPDPGGGEVEGGG